MATKPKTKPSTAAAKATPKNLGSKAAPKGKTAAKASEKAAKPATKPAVILEVGTFVKFGGYRANVDKSEAIFKEGDILYIVEVDNDDTGVLYSAIPASEIAEYEQNGDDNVTGGQVAPAEVTELKGSALEKARDTFMPVVMIGKLAELMEANDDPIQVAIELNQNIQQTYFWLGGALARVLQVGAHLKENGGDYTGEEAFNDFCQSEFGFKASKGRQLARVYLTFSQIPNFDPSKLDAVGWSKAAIAERFVTEENVEKILDIAETTGQRELAATLKEKFVKENVSPSGKAVSRATVQKSTLTFRLEEDAAETVKLALQQCKKQSGIEDDNLALERIMLEWANDHVEADTIKKKIASKAAKVAKTREIAAAETAAAAAIKAAKAKPAAAPAAKTGVKPAPKKK